LKALADLPRLSFSGTEQWFNFTKFAIDSNVKLKTTMGKGDKKSKRGKIASGSYGVRRKRKKATAVAPVAKKKKAPAKAKVAVEAAEEAKPAAKKKTPAKKAAAAKTVTDHFAKALLSYLSGAFLFYDCPLHYHQTSK
jgi:ribosomal small subunit protein bTHX